jgi:hypothetical protein
MGSVAIGGHISTLAWAMLGRSLQAAARRRCSQYWLVVTRSGLLA